MLLKRLIILAVGPLVTISEPKIEDKCKHKTWEHEQATACFLSLNCFRRGFALFKEAACVSFRELKREASGTLMKTTSKQHFLGSIVLLLALLTCEMKTTMYNGFCKFYDFYYLSLMQLHKYTSKPESWSRQGNGTVVPYRSLLYTRKPWKKKKESKEFLGKVQLQNCLNDTKQVILDPCVSEKAGTLSKMEILTNCLDPKGTKVALWLSHSKKVLGL